jgi:2-Cys peroxiredoxin 5
MFAARHLSLARPFAGRRLFHASAPAFVKVGDKLPNVELMENSPGNKVNIANELKTGKGLIIGKLIGPLLQLSTTKTNWTLWTGVPAAYSPACSENHIPGYINSAKLKDAGKVFVVSVNDSFV